MSEVGRDTEGRNGELSSELLGFHRSVVRIEGQVTSVTTNTENHLLNDGDLDSGDRSSRIPMSLSFVLKTIIQ